MRPAKWLIAVLLLLPASAEAQTSSASVTLRATVSETVALSALPNSIQSDVAVNVVNSSGNTVRITLSGNDAKAQVISVPLLVRSNSGFKISAVFESQTAKLDQLSVIDVHATGGLVSRQAVNALVGQTFLSVAEQGQAGMPVLQARPLLVLTGPRISLGGTLTSPNNALRITVLIRLKPQPVSDWLVHLTLAGSAEPLIQ